MITSIHGPAWMGTVLLWFALSAPQAARADLVLDSNFNGENGGVPTLNFASFSSFNVTAGSVDLIGNGFFDFYPGNGLYVDLNGSTGVSGTLTSKLVFAPGTYQLSFSLGNNSSSNGTNSVTVSLDGYNETFSRTGAVPLETINRTLAVTSASSLVFATPAGDSDDTGIILDNVRLATITTTTPEPSTVAMIASAVPLVLVHLLRRRKHVAA